METDLWGAFLRNSDSVGSRSLFLVTTTLLLYRVIMVQVGQEPHSEETLRHGRGVSATGQENRKGVSGEKTGPLLTTWAARVGVGDS